MRPPERAEVVEALARAIAHGATGDVDRRRASELLTESGVDAVFEALEMAVRIIKTGEGFHSIERFFVDGSPEQRYLDELVHPGPRQPQT